MTLVKIIDDPASPSEPGRCLSGNADWYSRRMNGLRGILQDKSKRPRVRPEHTRFDHLLWFLAVSIAVSCVGYAFSWYPSLPASVPTKMGGNGQVTATGPAWTIMLMPALGILLVFMMLLLQRWPWLSNTLIEITEDNALVQYRLVNRLLSLVAIEVGLIFFLVTWNTIGTAMGTPTNAFSFIIIFSTCSWLPLLGWYFWASFKAA